MEKFRDRKFCLLLYPLEDETHKRALQHIIDSCYDYAYIVHDKDTNEEDVLKKSHTHVVLTFNEARWSTSLALELEIGLNYIQKCRSKKFALEYLLHLNDTDKYLYDIEEVHGTLKPYLIKLYKKMNILDEDETFYKIIEFLNSNKRFITFSELSVYCCENNLFSTYRRCYNLFRDILYEHNCKYM